MVTDDGEAVATRGVDGDAFVFSPPRPTGLSLGTVRTTGAVAPPNFSFGGPKETAPVRSIVRATLTLEKNILDIAGTAARKAFEEAFKM